WRIVNAAGKPVAHGEWPAGTIPVGKNFALGQINVDLANLAAPQAYRLVVQVRQPSGPAFENDWNFWLYPAKISDATAPDVLVTASWAEAEAKLASGAKVLFLPR